MPHAVDLIREAANVSGGISMTRSGEAGGDIAGMVNIPVVRDVLRLRAVGYREQ